MRHNLRFSLTLVIGAFAVSTAQADLIYRETFGHTNSTADQPLKGFGWGVHAGTKALDKSADKLVSVGSGKPSGAAAVNNVNAGGSSDALAVGYYWGDVSGEGLNDETRRVIVWTPEYSFNPANYVPGSLVFSWYQGNASTTDAMRIAIRIAGQWYVSESVFTTNAAVTSGGNFFRGNDQGNGDAVGHGAELKAFTFTSNSSAWRQLTFDGTFNSVTNIGASGTVLSMAGTTLVANLPAGMIDAFGLFANDPTSGKNRRFDTFTIAGEPVPEPSTFALLAGGLLAVALARRRKA